MAYIQKSNLVEYVIGRHLKIKGRDITPIKLQKTLYLLYAMWAGNAGNMNKNMDKQREDELGICEQSIKLDTNLFDADFEAWQYGPVDREVYFTFKEGKYGKSELDFLYGDDSIKTALESFIDNIVDQCFNINDFALVDLTHVDESWKKIYAEDPSGQTLMDNASIKEEYMEKLK